jgi:hypothetical protein
MEVHVTGELEAKLTHSAARQGRNPDDLVQDLLKAEGIRQLGVGGAPRPKTVSGGGRACSSEEVRACITWRKRRNSDCGWPWPQPQWPQSPVMGQFPNAAIAGTLNRRVAQPPVEFGPRRLRRLPKPG